MLYIFDTGFVLVKIDLFPR